VPETERTHPLSGWNRPNPGRVHVSYRAVLRGWAFPPLKASLIEAVKASIQPGATPGIPYLEDRFKVTINSFRNMLTKLGLSPRFNGSRVLKASKAAASFTQRPPADIFPCRLRMVWPSSIECMQWAL